MQTLLALHIFGALLTFLLIFQAIFILFSKKETQYQISFTSVALAGALQCVSGSGWAILNPGATSLFAFCNKFTFYLSMIFITEGLLFYRLQKLKANGLAQKSALSTLGAGLFSVISAIIILS